jgi:hypothetical protein
MRIRRVFVLWETSPGVELWAVHIYDGITRIAALPAIRPASPPTGRNGARDLVEGVSMFTMPVAHEMRWSVGISVAVAFLQDGNITFFSAGAEFST